MNVVERIGRIGLDRTGPYGIGRNWFGKAGLECKVGVRKVVAGKVLNY